MLHAYRMLWLTRAAQLDASQGGARGINPVGQQFSQVAVILHALSVLSRKNCLLFKRPGLMMERYMS